MNICEQCGETFHPKPNTKGLYCSRSCSAKVTNKTHPKRKLKTHCNFCGKFVRSNRKFCSENCRNEARLDNQRGAIRYKTRSGVNKKDLCECGNEKQVRSLHCGECVKNFHLQQTLGELRSKSVRDAQVYNRLRQTSRGIASKTMQLECIVCGYDKHVEVCHIKPLSSLPDETSVLDAISPSNFILLCPNHHWELDYGDLEYEHLCLDSNQEALAGLG